MISQHLTPSVRVMTNAPMPSFSFSVLCPQPDVKQAAYTSLKRGLGLVGPFTRISVLEELMEQAADDAVRRRRRN